MDGVWKLQVFGFANLKIAMEKPKRWTVFGNCRQVSEYSQTCKLSWQSSKNGRCLETASFWIRKLENSHGKAKKVDGVWKLSASFRVFANLQIVLAKFKKWTVFGNCKFLDSQT